MAGLGEIEPQESQEEIEENERFAKIIKETVAAIQEYEDLKTLKDKGINSLSGNAIDLKKSEKDIRTLVAENAVDAYIIHRFVNVLIHVVLVQLVGVVAGRRAS